MNSKFELYATVPTTAVQPTRQQTLVPTITAQHGLCELQGSAAGQESKRVWITRVFGDRCGHTVLIGYAAMSSWTPLCDPVSTDSTVWYRQNNVSEITSCFIQWEANLAKLSLKEAFQYPKHIAIKVPCIYIPDMIPSFLQTDN